ncbi:MAG: hypothetical protein NCW75_06140 [Phycisphaera sp.]|nr:MAG: hypothetical protein NCW75_06140 [Phycisphaera sp.]
MNNTSSVVVAILAAVGTIATASAQDINWDNAAGGFWNDTANWNPMEVPNVPGESAIIGLPGSYAALIRSLNVNIDGLFITNPTATVGIGGTRDLRISGPTATIDGTLVINDTGSASAARLLPGNTTVAFDGSGEIVMNDTTTTAAGRAQILDAFGGLSTIFGSDLTVRGSGQFNTNATINGLLLADAPGFELAILGTPKTNNGVFRVDNDGVMRLSVPVIQGPGGRIEVVDGRLNLRSTISGGEIDSTGGIFEIATGNGVFDNIERVTGDIAIENTRDLQVAGGLTIDGTIVVNREMGASASRLLFTTSGTLDGDATIVMNDTSTTAAGRAQFIDAAGGLTITLADTVLVRGSGQMNSNLINNGVIRADRDGLEMAFVGTPKTNNNLIEINDGGVVRLSTVINQGPAGRIVVNDGRLNLRSTISGGEIDSTGGIFEIATGNGVFDNIERVTGDIAIENTRDLQVAGGLTIDGTIVVNREMGASASRLLFTTSGTLDGDATIVMNDTSTTAAGRAQFIDAAGGLTITLADTVLVRGSGQMNSNLINNGVIRADRDGLEMAFVGTPKTNNNLIEINDGGVVRLSTVINQGPAGRIVVNDGRLNLRSTINGGEIDSTGGVFEIANGNGVLNGVDQVTGDIEVENTRDLRIGDGLTIDGTIVINSNGGSSASRLLTTNSSTVNGNGELFLNGTAPRATPGRAQLIRASGGVQNTFGPDFSITGNGQINGDFIVQGTIAPGRSGSAVGETGILTAFVELAMEDTTRVEIQIGGRDAGDFDHIAGTATITVDGTLEASIIDGFEAGVCENFVIISGTSVTGEFDTFIPPVATSNRKWRLFYTGTSVDLRNTCLADIDGDCELTLFDFLGFQNLFDAGSLEADFDGDGSLTLFDFLAFQNAFSRGCD